MGTSPLSIFLLGDHRLGGIDLSVAPLKISDVGADQMEHLIVQGTALLLGCDQQLPVQLLVDADFKGDFIFHYISPTRDVFLILYAFPVVIC